MNERDKIKEICDYVKKNILKYDDTMKIPKHFIMRLKGFRCGQFIINNKVEKNALYDWDLIFKTLKYSSYEINNYINKNKDKIKDEQHLINLIFTFMEKDINNVAERIKAKEQSKKQLDSLDNSQIVADKADYIPKTENKKFRKDIK